MTGLVELPHLDVMVCTACQLKCVGCTNAIGALPMEIWPADDIKADIDAAAAVMHAEVACLLGGEPTSHPRLVDLMRYTAASGLGERVQVLTNGMRLHRMPDTFWAELDWLKVSIYPGRTPTVNIALAQKMRREHGFDLDFYDVRSDPFRAVLTDRARTLEDAQRTYDGCWYKTFTRKIEQGHFWRCCTSPQISQTVLGLAPDTDGIKLDGLTPGTLQDFLDRPDAMASCTRCFANTGPRIPFEEVTGREAWLQASMAPIGSA